MFSDFKSSNVLILSPHTDDTEIGMGGTLSQLCEYDMHIKIIVFCNAVESLPVGYSDQTLISEQYKAASCFGLTRENVDILDFPVRNFDQHRQSILELLIKQRDEFNPSLVFCPAPGDIHQDHQTITNEAVRAFKMKTLLGYTFPWNQISDTANYFVELREQDVNKKIKAVNKFKSQSRRIYTSEDSIRATARSNGLKVGLKYVEAFSLIRSVTSI